jgi:hypothetical protein
VFIYGIIGAHRGQTNFSRYLEISGGTNAPYMLRRLEDSFVTKICVGHNLITALTDKGVALVFDD